MSIESTVAGAVESVAEGAVKSTAESAVGSVATSAVSSIAGGLLGSFNPMSYLKMAGYAAIGIAVLSAGYEVFSYVRQAQADHDAVASLTAQRDDAVKTADDNAAALTAANAEHAAIVASAEAAKTQAAAASSDLHRALEGLSHANTSSKGCVPSAAAAAVLDKLRSK